MGRKRGKVDRYSFRSFVRHNQLSRLQRKQAAVIEAKWTDREFRLEEECEAALRQIEEKQYAVRIARAGFEKVGKLGIAFFEKQCLVRKG